MSTLVTEQPPLAQGLLNPAAYPFSCQLVELVETHISWVFLTGDFAYKVKKPVNLGFLDFSTLELRRHYCREELRLNSRLAKEIYIEVVPITGTPEAPQVEGQGEPIDWAVKMHQFDQSQLLSHQAEEERLQPWQLDRLGDLVAEFHEGATRAGADDPYGTPELTHRPALENFEVLQHLIVDPARYQRLSALRLWTEQEYAAVASVMAQRRRDGFVRECHGDLHLGNITQIEDRIVAFDGIEFNDSFRWIDVMSEVAFLFTDLEHRGRRDLGWRVLSRYLESSGDFAGLRLLRYYNLYRIMVRLKVEALRLEQPGVDACERRILEAEMDRYLSQAEAAIRPRTTAMILTRGLSGSGKTFLSQGLLQAMGAIRLRSDVERKRIFGLAPTDHSSSGLGEGLYSREATERTFTRLLDLSRLVLEAGFPVIVDATFLDPAKLHPFRLYAQQHQHIFRVVDLLCPEKVLRSRLARRVGDASEAGEDVLNTQLVSYRPLEEPDCVHVTSSRAWDPHDLLAYLKLKA
jgi:hypothetical protein